MRDDVIRQRGTWRKATAAAITGLAVLIAATGGPVSAQFHLQVVQTMGGAQQGDRRDGVRRFNAGDSPRAQGRRVVER